MGIFGALNTSVTGMRAQSFALENISGNIANSQTTAYKRIDTSFVDLIPSSSPGKQLAGNVVANSRSTNTVQGDIQNSSIGTFMAINGDGFFVVQKPAGMQDNRPIFDGIDLYTRRGDFRPDKNGYLVNGAGYHLMGIPVDATTGNLVGSVPQLLKFQNDFLPAQATTRVDYRTNLASYPRTPNADPEIPRSELLQQANYAANPIAGPPQPARILGSGGVLLPDAPATSTGTMDLGPLVSVGGDLVINGQTIAINPGDDAAAVLAAINAETANTGITASLTSSGRLHLSGSDADTPVTVGGGSTLAVLDELGLSVGTTNATNLLSQAAVSAGQTLTLKVGNNPTLTITFGNGPGEVSTMAELATALGSLSGGTAVLNTSNGNITTTAGNMTDRIVVGGDAEARNFGMHTLSALPANGAVVGSDVTSFVNDTVGGGAITVFDKTGTPVNVQLRWAKVDSELYGGTEKWNLFYQVNSNASGDQVAWKNVGIDYTFGPNGQMSPQVANVTLNNVTVDGVALGDIQVFHGTGGITQFSDPNGNANITLLQQNGYPAGELQQVDVNEKGRVVGIYSNGRTIEMAEIVLANFNGPEGLKRLDGGAFQATDQSGVPTYGASGQIVNSALEGSNADIADEFTKLIVTQQAYSANTRVITTANQMVQDLLNMLR